MTLRRVARGVHVADAPQRFFGLEMGTRMTVLELSGGLLVHSPVALDPSSIAHLGELRWVIAPNLFHHLYVGPWAAAGAEAWGAPGLARKRPDVAFKGELDPNAHPFGDEIELLPLSSFPMSNEVLVLHRPSGTLITSDLVFNLPPSAPAMTRLAMRGLGGYPGCRSTLLERVAMKRDVARKEIGEITSRDYDRVIMAHGDIIETGGRDAIAGAFGWLR